MDMYFWVFPVAKLKKKSVKNEKKIWCRKWVGLLPNCVTTQWEIVL